MENIFERVNLITEGIQTDFLKLKEGVKAKLSTKIDIGVLRTEDFIREVNNSVKGRKQEDFADFFKRITDGRRLTKSEIVINEAHLPIITIFSNLSDYLEGEGIKDYLTTLSEIEGFMVLVNISYCIDNKLMTIIHLVGNKQDIINEGDLFIPWEIHTFSTDDMFDGLLCSMISCTKLSVSEDGGKNYYLKSMYYDRDVYNVTDLADEALTQYNKSNNLSKHIGVDVKVEVGLVSIWESDVPDELITDNIKDEVDNIIAEEGITLLDYVELHSNMKLTQ